MADAAAEEIPHPPLRKGVPPEEVPFLSNTVGHITTVAMIG